MAKNARRRTNDAIAALTNPVAAGGAGLPYRIDVTNANWTANEKKSLLAWMADLNAWALDVRDDIIRLEGAAGGDPGDPPPLPGG